MLLGETVLSGAESSKENSHVSEFKVMKSAAGWYVGTEWISCGSTECKECSFGTQILYGLKGQPIFPNSRETDYFNSKEEAEKALNMFLVSGVLDKQRH